MPEVRFKILSDCIKVVRRTAATGRGSVRGVPLALLLVALLLGGCAWTDKSGTHHLIVGIGFGVITTTNRPGVDVWDSHVLGAEAGPSGFGVGWMGHNRVVLDPVLASNVVVSIQARHFGVTVKNFDPYSKNTTNIQTKSVSDSKTRP